MIRTSIVQRNKSKGIYTWYVRIFNTDTGETKYRSLLTDKKGEAKELLSEMLRDGTIKSATSRKRMSLKKGMELFLKDVESRNLSLHYKNTLDMSFHILAPLLNKDISEISKQDIKDAFYVISERYSSGSYNLFRTILGTLFNYFIDTLEIIDKSPLRGFKGKKKKPKFLKDFWTIEEIEKILDNAPDEETRLFWSFMAFAGLRLSEALSLTRKDIQGKEIHVVGKGSKFATIPISRRLQSEIDKCPNFNFSKKGRSLLPLQRSVLKAFDGNVKGATNFHRFRHSFASNLIRKGVNIKAVQMLMRHANIQITLNTYSHLLKEDLSDAVEL